MGSGTEGCVFAWCLMPVVRGSGRWARWDYSCRKRLGVLLLTVRAGEPEKGKTSQNTVYQHVKAHFTLKYSMLPKTPVT